MSARLDLDKPRYDQNTFEGRAKHFFITTNPLNVLASDADLEKAKKIVDDYRAGIDVGLSEDEIWSAKQLYDSAYHCQTGEKLFVMGRMSFQVDTQKDFRLERASKYFFPPLYILSSHSYYIHKHTHTHSHTHTNS